MKIIDHLFGKQKLQEDLSRLNLENEQLKIQNEELLKDIQKVESERLELKRYISNIKIHKAELKTKLEKIQSEFTVMHNQSYEVINDYKNRYGELPLEVNNQENTITEYDQDKEFFDYMKPMNNNNDFNKDQVEAIRYRMDKHLRIIAGAGSGKTQTICAKAAYLTLMEGVSEDKIAMVTFTRKAKDEMIERINQFLKKNSSIVVSTFHGLFMKMFSEVIVRYPYLQTVGVQGEKIDDVNYNKYMKYLINKYKLNKLNDQAGPKNLVEKISYWLNMGYTIEQMKIFIKEHFDGLESNKELPLSERFYSMMSEFEETRKKKKIIIFDDYLTNLLRILEQDEQALLYVQNRFRYIFIDEFQDTNPLQMKIIKLICPPNSQDGAKLIIVGDDDQSIYFFRGAEPKYIKEFDYNYQTHTCELMTNYRSVEKIVQVGNKIITNNSHDRIKKTMIPFHKKEGDCFIKALSNSNDEALWIIEQAKKLGSMIKPFKDMPNSPNFTKSVILYRSSSQITNILNLLEVNHIPYVIETEDLMGIFNIKKFYIDFKNWQNFIDVDHKYGWVDIVRNTAYSFFKSKSDVDNFVKEIDNIKDLNKIVDFICNKNGMKNEVQQYLINLVRLIKGKDVNLQGIINNYLKFPVVKNELSADEIKWIEKEIIQYNSWDLLLERYNKLRNSKEEMKDRLKKYNEGKLNALYLLTIHKSKGLAFDNVFIIGVHNEGLPSHKAIKLDKSKLNNFIQKADPPSTIEEERRLMYVAITRAKKNLYITFPKLINDKPCKRSIFLKETALEFK
ncbi:UvrD-helicase domain-containing protein [Bacillus cereus]|uniref:UvrD-helicase domain-containing protein n=1 Tax=Bacillus cereus TaxID=1396 RepID=UPI001D0EE2AD|nr:UvrD-helicase domain-containing protein [Bacillus cereus]MCC2384501.1 UvrD-helicase domain-containing protein [Bacillus cereus]MEC3249084.1 UvrD-helicase domain-containing protein [Bacillus cereus]